MATEVEAKFLADGPEILEQLAAVAALGRAALDPPNAFDEVDRYLDTHDGHLASAGWACRLRRRGDSVRVSLKGAADAASGGWLHHRPEIEAPAADTLDPREWPPSEARALAERLSEGHPLHERFRLIQHRTERGVVLDGARIGTLSLDTVAVGDGSSDAGTLYAVELELAPTDGAPNVEPLTELAAVLAARPGLEPDPRTKLQHALAVIGSP